MSIKPDHWIRRMALEHGMIDPFVEKQVREGMISYGLSSYGYDIRLAYEFKVFTNVNNTIVDPKNFDNGSFVDFQGETCTIPPNSFILSQTVEKFKIPRNVLAVCVGKCLTGDTRIVDADTGEYLPISAFATHKKTIGLSEWCLGKVQVSDFISQGVKPVYELETRLGLKIKATANHPFRQLHGWTPLGELKKGDRIAIAREIPVFGKTPLDDWEAALLGMMVSEGQCHTPHHSPTYTSQDPIMVNLLEKCVREGLRGEISHKGRYGYRLVNKKGRGGHMTTNRANLWLEKHQLNVGAIDKFVPSVIFTAPAASVKLFLQTLFAGDGSIYTSKTGESVHLEYYSRSRRLIEDIHHLLLRFGIFALIKEKKTYLGDLAYTLQITAREHILAFAAKIGFFPESIKQKRLEDIIANNILLKPQQKSNFDTLPKEAWDMLQEVAAQHGKSLNDLGIPRSSKQSVSITKLRNLMPLLGSHEIASLTAYGPIWDTVKSITYIGEEEVYDITVPEVHNFIANDLIVHNSTYARTGLIVNVTPLEPEWEGYLTLEISNTTPLPAKIYAGEGIAQLLFFESDEPCEISYADRKGKYQNQVGVTLPRL